MNLFLLSPELSLIVLSLLLIVLDLYLPQKRVLAAIALIGLAAPVVFSLLLLDQQGTSFNGMLVVDSFSLFFKFLFVGAAALTILSSVDYVSRFPRFQGEYYALILLSTVGMMLLAGTGELISIFIALELTSIPLYILSGFLGDRRASEAGLKYLLLGALSSAIVLYGMALIFGITGTTDLREIAQKIGAGDASIRPALLLGTVFWVSGLGFKISAVPFHMWAPDVYEGAPTPITAFLSVASKAAGFAIILRLFHIALGGVAIDWPSLYAVLAAITMTLGNVVAIWQGNIKRLLAYSSIAHAGYILIAVATVSSAGTGAVLFYLVVYALTNLGAFIAVIAISNRIGSDSIPDYAGMAKRAPLLALGLTVCLLSLTGIPPTAGFIGKFYLFRAAVEGELTWLVLLGVLNSAISAYYYLKVVKVMYLDKAESETEVAATPPIATALATSLAGVVLLGLFPAPIIALVEAAARALSS